MMSVTRSGVAQLLSQDRAYGLHERHVSGVVEPVLRVRSESPGADVGLRPDHLASGSIFRV